MVVEGGCTPPTPALPFSLSLSFSGVRRQHKRARGHVLVMHARTCTRAQRQKIKSRRWSHMQRCRLALREAEQLELTLLTSRRHQQLERCGGFLNHPFPSYYYYYYNYYIIFIIIIIRICACTCSIRL